MIIPRSEYEITSFFAVISQGLSEFRDSEADSYNLHNIRLLRKGRRWLNTASLPSSNPAD